MQLTGKLVNVTVYRNGSPTRVYYRRGDNMAFVQAEPGDNIKIRVTAKVRGRLEAYLSVDGRSAHRNVAADYVNDRGLVFTGETMFTGYRLNTLEVSPFTVTYPENSVLAVTTGGTTNAGAIGLAIFREWQEPRQQQVYSMGDMSDAGAAKSVLESAETLRGSSPVGMTGRGRQTSVVGTTTFEREMDAMPNEIIVIQYRPMWWLRNEGIVGGRTNDPSPFPGSDTGYDFLR